MEPKEKKQQRKLLQELLEYHDKGKGLMNLGLFLSGVSAIGLIFPIIFLWLAVREIFLMYPNITLTHELQNYVYLSAIIAISSMILYCIGLLCTHKVAFTVAKNIRYKSLSHLMELPLGYFQKSGSGKLRRLISDSAGRTETYIAHQL